jgi:hypothetical protein
MTESGYYALIKWRQIMAKTLLLGVAACSLLTGCSSNALRYASVDKEPADAKERETTGATLAAGECARPRGSEGGGSAFIAPIVGMAVDFAVTAAGAELKRRKEGRNAIWSAATGTDPLTFGSDYCLNVFRAVITKSQGGKTYGVLPAGLFFKGEPAFLLQTDLAWGKLGADGKSAALKATPYQLRYAETAAPVRGKNRKDVSVVLAFSPQTLQPSGGAATIPETKAAPAVMRLDFGRLDVGRSYDKGLLGTVSAVASLPVASAPPSFATAAQTITAVVSESENSTIALDALISAFDSNKDDLSAALKKTIEEAVGSKEE